MKHLRYMYARVSSVEAQNIRNILAEAGDRLPKELKKEIEFDLEHVEVLQTVFCRDNEQTQ